MADFNDLHLVAGPEAVMKCIESAINLVPAPAHSTGATVQSLTWAAPKEIKTDLPLAPDFNAKALLPPKLADFVMDEADRMPCPPD